MSDNNEKEEHEHIPQTTKAMTVTDARLRGMAAALGIPPSQLAHPIFHNYVAGHHKVHTPGQPFGEGPLPVQPSPAPPIKVMENVLEILEKNSRNPFADRKRTEGGQLQWNPKPADPNPIQSPDASTYLQKGKDVVSSSLELKKDPNAWLKKNIPVKEDNYPQQQFKNNVDAMKANKPFPYDGSKNVSSTPSTPSAPTSSSSTGTTPLNALMGTETQAQRDAYNAKRDAMDQQQNKVGIKITYGKDQSRLTNPPKDQSRLKEALVNTKEPDQKRGPRIKGSEPGTKCSNPVPTRDLNDSVMVNAAVAILSEKRNELFR